MIDKIDQIIILNRLENEDDAVNMHQQSWPVGFSQLQR